MPLVSQLALVSDTQALGFGELATVAGALQKQIARDLAPLWNLQGIISPFARLEDVPPGYWPIIVRDDIDRDAAGYHCDQHGQPVALVTLGPGWSVTASHEAMEMLVDPFGNRTVAGQSLKSDQGRVEYLVEIADPIGDSTYSVNGVLVADFCTPHYFDPLQASGVLYCFTGAIAGPRQLLANGYLTWHDPVSNQWWQQSRFSSVPRIDSLGSLLKSSCGTRATVDRLAARRRREAGVEALPGYLKSMSEGSGPAGGGGVAKAVLESSRAKAESWQSLLRDRNSKPTI